LTLREIIGVKALEAGSRLIVRSALNPMLWLVAIVTIASLVFMGVSHTAPLWLIILAFTPVVAVVAGFFYLLFFDREKLQSEDFQIRSRALELIEQKGDSHPLLASAIREVIPNPEPSVLPETEDRP
jgi:hypothetical protein